MYGQLWKTFPKDIFHIDEITPSLKKMDLHPLKTKNPWCQNIGMWGEYPITMDRDVGAGHSEV